MHKSIHICKSHKPTHNPKLAKEYVFANADGRKKKKYDRTTMCIIHKGFRGFRTVLPALIFSCKLISLKPAIPYEIIH